MADNVDITPGSGATIATEDVGGGVEYQKIKIAAGKAASTVMIGHLEDDAHASGDAGIMGLGVRRDAPVSSGGTDGDYVPEIFDNEGLQWIRPAPKMLRFTATPTISTSAYATGDNLCAIIEITNAVRKAGGSGTLMSVTINDVNPSLRAAMDLVFFDRTVTLPAANAVWNVSDADMLNCLGIIPAGAYNTAFPATILNVVSTLVNIGLPIVCSGTSLFVAVIIRGTPTYVGTTDLTFNFIIAQD